VALEASVAVSAAKLVVRITEFATPVGEMIAAANDTHLLLFEFARPGRRDAQLERVKRAFNCDFETGDSPVFDKLRVQLDEYFRAGRTAFDIPLDTPGTPFQMLVWNELQRIPVGTTTTYKRVAEAIGQPSAVRAVANANGDNRIAILIPCHRVIGSDGSLTGYGGGLPNKKKLLDLEAHAVALTLPGF
jgi:AraC family transcriptional regulator, regulatory protein of adaptative response / methylated-DNA-[protein]-cysteine methyltransferase